MAEDNERTLRIPMGEQPKVGHRIRTVVVSRDKGIKAMYNRETKSFIATLFEKAKGWTEETATAWVAEAKKISKYNEIYVDQELEFIKLAVTYEDDKTEMFEPSYGETFTFTKEMAEEERMTKDQKADPQEVAYCPNCKFSGKGKPGDDCPECGSKLKKKPSKEDKGCSGYDKPRRRQRTKAFYAKCHGCFHEEEIDELPKARGKCPACEKELVYKSVVLDIEQDDRIVSFENEDQEAVVMKAMPVNYRQGDAEQSCLSCEQSGCGYCAKFNTSVSNNYVCDGWEQRQTAQEATPSNEEKGISQALDIVKTDKSKQIVYGVFLWPDKADHDGDIISVEDIEKVAHEFLVEYRDIDEMHKKETIDAEIVESFLSWMDNLEYYGKMLTKGAWAGAIHVRDKKVWEKIEKGEYKGFSVRISGTREPVTSSSVE